MLGSTLEVPRQISLHRARLLLSSPQCPRRYEVTTHQKQFNCSEYDVVHFVRDA